jgi:hypothetical protein
MADSVPLTDLDVIARYSIAVRTASADRDELIETLRADLEWLERNHRAPRPSPVADAGVAEEFEPDQATAPEPHEGSASAQLNQPTQAITVEERVAPAPKRTAAKRAVKKAGATRTPRRPRSG